jgi:hypothetical protein
MPAGVSNSLTRSDSVKEPRDSRNRETVPRSLPFATTLQGFMLVYPYSASLSLTLPLLPHGELAQAEVVALRRGVVTEEVLHP